MKNYIISKKKSKEINEKNKSKNFKCIVDLENEVLGSKNGGNGVSD
jgi:hypothetical protein